MLLGRHVDLIIRALAPGPGSSPGRDLGTFPLLSSYVTYSSSLRPGVQMGTGEFNAGE